jgi:hypothetical protein
MLLVCRDQNFPGKTISRVAVEKSYLLSAVRVQTTHSMFYREGHWPRTSQGRSCPDITLVHYGGEWWLLKVTFGRPAPSRDIK